jgi:hypothetical protein
LNSLEHGKVRGAILDNKALHLTVRNAARK